MNDLHGRGEREEEQAITTVSRDYGVMAAEGDDDEENRSVGFPRTGYFVPVRDGTTAWQISGVIRVTARARFF